MNCPNCNETLLMTDREGVEIDYCPKCRGVWLDRGELDKIIEKSASYSPDTNVGGYEEKRDYPPRDKYNEPYNQKNDPYYQRRKKKGFLGDLFDFD